jgi:hypothetical protein
MDTPQISFRPYIEFTGIYDTGLAGAAVNAQGDLGNTSSYGVAVTGGISGVHSWRHTKIGLDYQGSIYHFTKATYYDSTNQSLMLGITHEFTRHTSLTLRETAGLFSVGAGLLGLPQTVPFDPASSYVPQTDFFDNRTVYLTTQADFTIQKSARLSFDFGGDGFINRRRSTALYGVTGAAARADVQYRLTRRTTIGGNYTFTHYDFLRIFGGTDLHGAAMTYATQLTKTLELSGYAGVMRMENKFVQTVPLDPILQQLFGVTSGTAVVHSVNYTPNVSLRLSQTYHRGVAYVSGGRTVTPGNGLFLTSQSTAGMAGYTYTGLRYWSFSTQLMYSNNKSVGNIQGRYRDLNAGVTLTRQITRATHAILSYSARDYSSPDYAKYNRIVYEVRLGIGFAPGDIPLRVW